MADISPQSDVAKLANERIGERVAHFVQDHARWILIAIGGAFVLAIAFLSYNIYRESAMKEAHRSLEEGLMAYSYVRRITNETEQSAYLNEAVKRFQAAVTKAASTDVALRANYYIGNAYYEMENYQSASIYFRKVANKRRFFLAPMASLHLIWSYIAQEQYEDAINEYKRFRAQHNDSYLAGEAALSASRVYAALKNPYEAIEVLKAYLKDHAGSTIYAEKAAKRIALLEAQVL